MRSVYPLPAGWKLQDSPGEPAGARDVIALDQDADEASTWYAVTISRAGTPVREAITGAMILIYRGPI